MMIYRKRVDDANVLDFSRFYFCIENRDVETLILYSFLFQTSSHYLTSEVKPKNNKKCINTGTTNKGKNGQNLENTKIKLTSSMPIKMNYKIITLLNKKSISIHTM